MVSDGEVFRAEFRKPWPMVQIQLTKKLNLAQGGPILHAKSVFRDFGTSPLRSTVPGLSDPQCLGLPLLQVAWGSGNWPLRGSGGGSC